MWATGAPTCAPRREERRWGSGVRRLADHVALVEWSEVGNAGNQKMTNLYTGLVIAKHGGIYLRARDENLRA